MGRVCIGEFVRSWSFRGSCRSSGTAAQGRGRTVSARDQAQRRLGRGEACQGGPCPWCGENVRGGARSGIGRAPRAGGYVYACSRADHRVNVGSTTAFSPPFIHPMARIAPLLRRGAGRVFLLGCPGGEGQRRGRLLGTRPQTALAPPFMLASGAWGQRALAQSPRSRPSSPPWPASRSTHSAAWVMSPPRGTQAGGAVPAPWTAHPSSGPRIAAREQKGKGASHSVFGFCPAFERATFRKNKGATSPR